ncbi:helix-turn-helix transcriptional regulator [Microbacterium sp. ARD31]|jgi:DNA-binding CsgD family transcriptional regulator|uniref:helix-turn-helix transcriptional regulator n=1 Tax=Microbacterium sp. ARD31 TaxID=2962576 RepID=UPI002881C021|nr:helix-turn-helix transcriptional regulator [Microbacterium sp. ARD31]MDT0180167.1 helix-turn-helix transcriptional regulator [Microbacterium sp. ARD31]
MDRATAWLAVAADVLAQQSHADATDILTTALIARTNAGLVSRIRLSATDPDRIDISVSGCMFQPGPTSWPTAAQVRGHPMARYRVATGDDTAVLMPDVLAAGWELDPASKEVMHDLRISDQQLSVPLSRGRAYDGWVLVAEERFGEREADEVRDSQRLLAGLDAHLRILARARSPVPDPGAPRLTPRERVVLTLAAEGCTAEAMARRLGISARTVHKHQEHLYRKLGACDRLSAVLAAQRRGLLD